MSAILVLLKAARLVDFGSLDIPLLMILFDLDLLVLLRFWWNWKRLR